MHCPRCGHQQNSDEIRYCSKCGLDISDVRNLLNLGSVNNKTKCKKEERKATKQGLIMIFAGVALIMILGALREFYAIPKIAIVLCLLVFMIGGMLRMFSPYLSDKSELEDEKIDSSENELETNYLSGDQLADKTLPEAQYQPPIDFGVKNYDTNELVRTPSVTEDTTRRLKNQLEQE